jgi:hypothetical protein
LKIIKFFSDKRFVKLGKPTPAKRLIPEWYKESESTYVDPKDPSGEEHAGLKKCMPYMDTMVSGYMLTTPVDIHVTIDPEGNPRFSWNGPESIRNFIDERTHVLGATMPRPAGHLPNHLVFSGFWGWKTPRGWSTLVTHPLNRHDLPFTTLSGIVDSDVFNAPGNIPFFLREGFSGTIPAGTPFAHVLPVKRASWLMADDSIAMQDVEKVQGTLVRLDGTRYKNIMWRRKEFN